MYSNVHINIITPFNLNVIFMHIKICHGHLITSNNGQIFFMQLGAFLQNVPCSWFDLFWCLLSPVSVYIYAIYSLKCLQILIIIKYAYIASISQPNVQAHGDLQVIIFLKKAVMKLASASVHNTVAVIDQVHVDHCFCCCNLPSSSLNNYN